MSTIQERLRHRSTDLASAKAYSSGQIQIRDTGFYANFIDINCHPA